MKDAPLTVSAKPGSVYTTATYNDVPSSGVGSVANSTAGYLTVSAESGSVYTTITYTDGHSSGIVVVENPTMDYTTMSTIFGSVHTTITYTDGPFSGRILVVRPTLATQPFQQKRDLHGQRQYTQRAFVWYDRGILAYCWL